MHRAAGRPVFPYPLDAIVKTALLTRTGAYRHIWHPALFNLALCIALLGGLFFLTRWMQS
ncbi:hypothetical protein BRM21_24965 [Xanthomonas oryzae pv. oryzae]|nr:hypothetical protein BRM27_23860 [Xanthomonas oryzae pv. oryzae]RBD22681.1 hypothetical protein BRM21_24965 [Xanthomonas oryzae pv. oryzae]RBD68071.1 hypothetical protein BRM19_24885 [Xanthomonas oryzae pv. oryzae]RBF21375.1 hypothetical protein BRM98_24385 [Xanthomonas oryzae pv. oryzae]RBG84028.1 hypothetical protein BRM18_22730 [Xanthomonas oryzae pv. oryzae]